MQLTGFEGRVALVTGAAGGIGEALVRLLVEAGCIVVATDREAPRVADSRVTSLTLDVTNSAAVDALVDQVESSIGPIMLAPAWPACCTWAASPRPATPTGAGCSRSTPMACSTLGVPWRG